MDEMLMCDGVDQVVQTDLILWSVFAALRRLEKQTGVSRQRLQDNRTENARAQRVMTRRFGSVFAVMVTSKKKLLQTGIQLIAMRSMTCLLV